MIRFSFVRTFVLTALIIATVQTSAFAENSERLEIVNQTGQDIKSYYLVQAGYPKWGKDRVGGKLFQNGQTRIFMYDPQFRYFKLKIVFENGRSVAWENDKKIDMLDAWRLTLYKSNDGKYRYAKNSRG